MASNSTNNLAIEINRLSKAFGRVQVLREFGLKVPWGERLIILGPNGSGKSTLIKVLATLSRPDRGFVRVAGWDLVEQGQQIRRIVGVVTHSPILYEQLTGFENLRFFGRMFNLDKLDERIIVMSERMGVGNRLHQRVGTLSHGLRKRFTIVRALLHEPQVLLMDEPESGLDQEALAMLDMVIDDAGYPTRTILMTTHNIERGLAIGDRIAILVNGQIVYCAGIDTSVGVDAFKDAYYSHIGDVG